ncbi:META domain-containing protein [Pareuzebyella sediminis]|uniref:META domain-containing protein n=1 Tax=Pareuzebyella sediminis TaxID=2607998 RepID=UPI0037448EA0
MDADTNTFLGFAGCNHMQGKLFFEDKLLRFSQIVTTKMACASAEKENDFLEALKKSKTCRFGNGRLELSYLSEQLLVFKKID